MPILKKVGKHKRWVRSNHQGMVEDTKSVLLEKATWKLHIRHVPSQIQMHLTIFKFQFLHLHKMVIMKKFSSDFFFFILLLICMKTFNRYKKFSWKTHWEFICSWCCFHSLLSFFFYSPREMLNFTAHFCSEF